jgi:hypothetical protein
MERIVPVPNELNGEDEHNHCRYYDNGKDIPMKELAERDTRR